MKNQRIRKILNLIAYSNITLLFFSSSNCMSYMANPYNYYYYNRMLYPYSYNYSNKTQYPSMYPNSMPYSTTNSNMNMNQTSSPSNNNQNQMPYGYVYNYTTDDNNDDVKENNPPINITANDDKPATQAQISSPTTSTTQATSQPDPLPALKESSPYAALSSEDEIFKTKLNSGFFDIKGDVKVFWAAQELAFRRGYFSTLLYLATNYGFCATPRSESRLYTPDPMIDQATAILNFTNSPILRYVATRFIQAIRTGKSIQASTEITLDTILSEADKFSWMRKSNSDIEREFLRCIDKLCLQTVTLSDSQTIRDVNDSKWTTLKENFYTRIVSGVLKYNSNITNEIINKAFSKTLNYANDGISSSNSQRAVICLKIARLLFRYMILNEDPQSTYQANKAALKDLTKKVRDLVAGTDNILMKQLNNSNEQQPVDSNTSQTQKNTTPLSPAKFLLIQLKKSKVPMPEDENKPNTSLSFEITNTTSLELSPSVAISNNSVH